MADPADTPRHFDSESESEEASRRSFLVHTATVLIGGVACIVPFLAGLMVFLDPLRRSSGQTKAKAIPVAPLSAVPDDGLPHIFEVISDKQDAWNKFVNVPIGSVYLIRKPGTRTVRALNSTCPHAGCRVAFLMDKKYFRCPCHTSAFNIEGQRMLEVSKVPPRDMDDLICNVKGNRVLVEYQDFYTGRHDKKPKT